MILAVFVRLPAITIARDLSREVVSFPRQGLTYPQSTLSTLKSDFVLERGFSHINQLQQAVGAAQVGPQGAAQLGAQQAGAAQLGAQPQPQRLLQQCNFGMWNFGQHSFGHFQRWQRGAQQLLQQLATGAQQVAGAAQLGAHAGAAQVGAQAGAQAGAAQVGAQAGAAHVGAQAGAAQLGAQAGAAQLGAAVQQLLQLL